MNWRSLIQLEISLIEVELDHDIRDISNSIADRSICNSFSDISNSINDIYNLIVDRPISNSINDRPRPICNSFRGPSDICKSGNCRYH